MEHKNLWQNSDERVRTYWLGCMSPRIGTGD